MVKNVGPFVVYYVENPKGTIDISLKYLEKYPFGFEYGWTDLARGITTPWFNIRIGKLTILYFEAWKWGLEFWLFGFWIIL